MNENFELVWFLIFFFFSNKFFLCFVYVVEDEEFVLIKFRVRSIVSGKKFLVGVVFIFGG